LASVRISPFMIWTMHYHFPSADAQEMRTVLKDITRGLKIEWVKNIFEVLHKNTILYCHERPHWVLKIVKHLWADRAPPRTPLRSSQQSRLNVFLGPWARRADGAPPSPFHFLPSPPLSLSLPSSPLPYPLLPSLRNRPLKSS